MFVICLYIVLKELLYCCLYEAFWQLHKVLEKLLNFSATKESTSLQYNTLLRNSYPWAQTPRTPTFGANHWKAGPFPIPARQQLECHVYLQSMRSTASG